MGHTFHRAEEPASSPPSLPPHPRLQFKPKASALALLSSLFSLSQRPTRAQPRSLRTSTSCSMSSSPATATRLLRRLCYSSSSSPSCPQPWLFIGLGNPGEKFKLTRHNVGFDMIDVFARSVGIPMMTVQCKALFGEGMVEGTPVLLAKPQTYMNRSGESIGTLAAYYKLPLNRVLVMYDDMDLPCGVLRLQPKGGHARHNGLKSLIYHFRGNREFGRLRIGISRPAGQMDPKAFLLQPFSKMARERIDSALEESTDILKTVLLKGLTEAARLYNTEQKYKHLRVEEVSSCSL